MFKETLKNSLEMSYKLMNELGKEVRRTNSITFDEEATDENMLAVSLAVANVMKFNIENTVNVKKIRLFE